MRIGVLAAILLTGCATRQVQTRQDEVPLTGERLPDSGAAEVRLAREDRGGDADFRTAASKAFAADPTAARAALEAFLANHPDHRQRPAALALLARAQLASGDAAGAKTTLEKADTGARTPDFDFLLGIAYGRLGNHVLAVTLLRPFLASGPPRIGSLSDAEAPLLLRAAAAEALAETGDPVAAIEQWDQYRSVDEAREHERAYARRRAEEVAEKIPGEAALSALSVPRAPFVRAVLGAHAVAALRARGDEASAVRLEQDVGLIRRNLGLDPGLQAAASVDPLRLGLAVPQSGAQARLGEVVLRGAMLVMAEPTASGDPSSYQLMVRDSDAPAERAGSAGVGGAAWSLSREESVIGLLGAPNPRGIELAARDGVPFLLLDDHSPGARTTAFQLIHAPESRAIALAQRALALGARRFVVLGPDSPSGKRLAGAFKIAVVAGGGALVAHITYVAGATSFSAQVSELRKIGFDALFVPDEATRLELIGPALAVADIWPRRPRLLAAPSSATAPTAGRREVLLLSTALSLSQKLLRNAERYVQGAMLCPGYYPAEDARSGNFVARFREAYGTNPTAVDAYGYDGLAILRGAVDRGARTRADVLRLVGSGRFEGMTGDIRFGPDHGRIDPPLIYFVEGDSIRLLR
jgi:ABC-type branched-subunit amino acid transport system substrate-binding protein